MKERDLFRRWRRRSAKILGAAQEWLRLCRTAGEPEQIHQLRVTLRRLRLVVRLGTPCFGKSAVVEFRDWSRQVSDAVGRLRDLDVTLEWLRGQPGAAAVAATLQPRRQRCWESCRRTLSPLPKKLQTRLTRWKAGRRDPVRTLKLYARYFQVHREEIVRVAPRLFALPQPERHAFRRTLRRLRYLRELGLSRRRRPTDPLLNRLIRLQEALGEYQNRGVASAILAGLRSSPRLRSLRQVLKHESRHWQAEIHRELSALQQALD